MPRDDVTVIVTPTGPDRTTQTCLDRLRPTLGPRDRVLLLQPAGSPAASARGPVTLVVARPGESLEDLAARVADTAATPLVADLHSDVVVTPHWLDRLAAALEDPAVDAAGPQLNAAPPGQGVPDAAYDDGTTSLRDYARVRAEKAGDRTTRPYVPLPATCRVARRAARGQLTVERSVVVHAAFVHHALDAGCPDTRPLPEDPHAPLLSASLIVKDEEDCLAECLAALAPFVDEVVVLDTGSTDRTVAIAEAAGATVLHAGWDHDFAAARNLSLAACSGRWVMVVDADEQVRGDVQALRRELERSTEEAYAVPIANLSSGNVGTAAWHHANRLLRRRNAMWRGRLHEQVVDTRRGDVLVGPISRHLTIDHSGYTPEVFARKGKKQRNLELAEADLRDTERFGGTSSARNNFARAVLATGDLPRAMVLFEQAWDGPTSRSARLMCTSAVNCAAELEDRDAGELWLRRLAETGECRPRLDVLRARLLGDTGDPAAGLELVERLPETATDADGVVFSRADANALHAGLLSRLGRHGEAADVALAGVRNGSTDWALDRHLATLRRADRPVADLAAAIHPRLRLAFLAQCLQVAPADGVQVLEALWELDPANDVLATATNRTGLPVADALRWSRRLRARATSARCPLVALAGDDTRAPQDRAVAALLSEVLGDSRSHALLADALAAGSDIAQARAEAVALLGPDAAAPAAPDAPDTPDHRDAPVRLRVLVDLDPAAPGARVVLCAVCALFTADDPVEVGFLLAGVAEPAEEHGQLLQDLLEVQRRASLPELLLLSAAEARDEPHVLRVSAGADDDVNARSIVLMAALAQQVWAGTAPGTSSVPSPVGAR